MAFAAVAAWKVGVPPAVVGAACLVLAVVLWRSYSAFDRSRRRIPGPSPADRSWLITDEEIHTSGAGTARTWRWPVVTRVDVLPDSYVLHPDSGASLDIPREALTGAQEAELRTFLERRGLLPS